ncbi:MAG: META domain-containing protein [Spirochaetaceae bacterium]|jgi:heat shock protein HslJ|nr:META domain-containing protein [Spirochaetaceae bacterium]
MKTQSLSVKHKYGFRRGSGSFRAGPVLFAALLIFAAGAGSCATAVKAQIPGPGAGGNFDGVAGKSWRLVEVQPPVAGKPVYSRAAIGDETAYTLAFDAEENRFGGKGYPNRYSGTYAVSGGDIAFSAMISTRMAALSEPASLSEHDFFTLLGNAASWETAEHLLILRSGTVTLVFQE